METGTVKQFDAAKGYGFIRADADGPTKPQNDGKDIFVHYTDIVGEGYRSLMALQRVRFERVETAKGLLAKNVEVIG